MTIDTARKENIVENSILSINEAKKLNIIPEDYKDVLKDKCPFCGSDIVTTKTLSKQFCVNPYCDMKVVGRAVKLLNNFGIKGIGRVYVETYFRNNENTFSHLDIIRGKKFNYYKTARFADSNKLMENIYMIRTTPITFPDVVSRLALPDLGSRANLVFGRWNSYQKFKNDLKEHNLTIKEYLEGLDGFDKVLAEKVERTLTLFEKELLVIPEVFLLRPVGEFKVKVCLTGDMDFHCMTKQMFIIYLNTLGEGVLEVIPTNARKSCDFIVSKMANTYEEGSTTEIVDYTSKHNLGRERNKAENRKVLITPEELEKGVIGFTQKIIRSKKARRDIDGFN